MGTHYDRDSTGKVVSIVTVANGYQYKGFLFEFHSYLGPTKMRKDGEPAKRQGKKFFDVIAEWEKLSKKEKEATRIYG